MTIKKSWTAVTQLLPSLRDGCVYSSKTVRRQRGKYEVACATLRGFAGATWMVERTSKLGKFCVNLIRCSYVRKTAFTRFALLLLLCRRPVRLGFAAVLLGRRESLLSSTLWETVIMHFSEP